MDALATPDLMITAIVEAEAEHVAGQTDGEASSLSGAEVAILVALVGGEGEAARVTPAGEGAGEPARGEVAKAT